MATENDKLIQRFATAPWFKKLQMLQILEGWNQYEAAEKYGTYQKTLWNWNNGLCIPQRNSRKAIALAHGLDVTDIFPLDILKPGELRKGA